MEGIKHLIQCHCILPQYKNKKEVVFHKFMVFSVIDDESDTVVTHSANCNNCGATHKIYDICKSEIVHGSEDISAVVNIQDFALSLPPQLYETLNQYSCELADYQHAQHIIDNKQWGSHIVLKREDVSDTTQGKMLVFVEENKYRIDSYIHNEYVQ